MFAILKTDFKVFFLNLFVYHFLLFMLFWLFFVINCYLILFVTHYFLFLKTGLHCKTKIIEITKLKKNLKSYELICSFYKIYKYFQKSN